MNSRVVFQTDGHYRQGAFQGNHDAQYSNDIDRFVVVQSAHDVTNGCFPYTLFRLVHILLVCLCRARMPQRGGAATNSVAAATQ